ncbi:MAG: xanthine dehydrogenase family protein molybdopterin-binding subunit [Acidimicrobiia bacterium]|nr:xanthine dehydrogenase family protein molybdopterin-binding subunit [Acidimicrobiia bacterium]
MRRVEDERFVTGQGGYVADLVPDDALHIAFVRSPLAHASIDEIDLDATRDADGVVAVVTAADLGLRHIPGSTGRGPAAAQMVRPVLADGTVRYVGEPVAAVVATSAVAAADAAELAWLELEELPVVPDFDAALSDGTLLHPAEGTNVAMRDLPDDGDLPRGQDEVEIEVVAESPRLAPTPIETLGIVAEPNGDGLLLRPSHAAPHRFRDQVASFLDLDPASVRVVLPDVGGAFGMKHMLYPEYLVVAEMARRLDRPVAWIQGRREALSGGTHGRGMRHRVMIGGDRSGVMRRLDLRIEAEVGAYPHNGSQIPLFTKLVAPGLYEWDEVRLGVTTVVTNRAPIGSYRGAGRPEAVLAIERAVDAFARAAGVDPVTVRTKNMLQPEQLPYETASGALYDSGDYPKSLTMALEAMDLDGLRAEQERRRLDGGRLLGIGFSSFIERAGGAPNSGEYGSVEVTPEGGLIVRSGSASAGMSHETVWAKLAAEVIPVPLGRVKVIQGDTAEVPRGVGSFASRSTQIGGSAVHRTAGVVRGRILEVASELLDAAPSDLDIDDGVVSVAERHGPGVGLDEVYVAAQERGVDLREEEFYSPGHQTFPYGVHVAVIEVEVDTGEIHLDHLVVIDDCGNIIDPMAARGQIWGSLMQGIGQALWEVVDYDDEGQLLSASLMNYLLPSSIIAPEARFGHLVSPAPSNPLGAKGFGESGTIGVPAAILNAALDALAPLGVDDLVFPLTPARVWEAIQAARTPVA